MAIFRERECRILGRLLDRHPVVGIIGARQVGKTTLARMFARQRAGPAHFFDLENPADLARLGDPLLAMQ